MRIYSTLKIDPLSFVTFFKKDLTTGWDYPEIILEDGEYYMILAKRPDGSCIFNRYIKDRLICKIHNIKPLVCRFYPFIYWIENDIVKFEVLDKAIGFCPGIGQGPPHDFTTEYKAVLEIKKAKEDYRRIVEKWNSLVRKGAVDPSPDSFIRYLINTCLNEV